MYSPTKEALQHQDTLDARLLHSLSLVAVGLSEGYETWSPNSRRHAFVIVWSTYRLFCLVPDCPIALWAHMTSGNSHRFQTTVIVPLHSPKGRHLPAVRALQGDCERVYLDAGSSAYFLLGFSEIGKCQGNICLPWCVVPFSKQTCQ